MHVFNSKGVLVKGIKMRKLNIKYKETSPANTFYLYLQLFRSLHSLEMRKN